MIINTIYIIYFIILSVLMQEKLVLRLPYVHTMNFSTLILSMDKNSYKITFYSSSTKLKSNLFIFLFYYSYIKQFVNLVLIISIFIFIKKDNFKVTILFYYYYYYYINSFFSSSFSLYL